MSHSDFFTGLRSTDHNFIATLRFLDKYVRRAVPPSHGHFTPFDEETHQHFVPRFDLEDHRDCYEIYGELPGVRKENLIVEANDNTNIVVSGLLTRIAARRAEEEGQSLPSERGDVGKGKAEDGEDLIEVKHTDMKSTPNFKHDTGAAKSTSMHAHSKPETARSGDELDPHAEFVKGETDEDDKVGRSHKPAESKPRVFRIISERHFGQFHRTFHFPSPINKDEVTARMENGVLLVTAPKAPVPPPRKVEVQKAVPLEDPLMF